VRSVGAVRVFVFTDATGRILGTVSADEQEVKPEPDSKDTMKVKITPESSHEQRVFEVELPSELEAIESPLEFQQALEGYRVKFGEVALTRRE
jgi:hypothetical protein